MPLNSAPEDFERAQAREGAIACTLFDDPDGQGAAVSSDALRGARTETTLHALNVSCNITPDPGKQAQQIDTAGTYA